MSKFLQVAAAYLLTAAVARIACAQEIPEVKRTRLGMYLSALQAAEMVEVERTKVLFLDIRTRAEIQFIGYAPVIDGVVPFVEMSQFGEWDDANNRYKLETNPTFSETVTRLLVAKGLTKTDKVVLICRSGDRSARASDLLQEAGYTKVYSVVEGFEGDLSPDGRRTVNGWKNAGLAWTYKMDKSKVYAPLH